MNRVCIILLVLICLLSGCGEDSAAGGSYNDTGVSDAGFFESVTEGFGIAKETASEGIGNVPDPAAFVGKARLGSAGSPEGIHSSDWTPRKKSPWICVARANDPVMRLRIADAMTKALKLDQVKYGQSKEQRVTFYQEAEKVGFDIPKVTAECYTSCTSVTSVCLRAAGFSKEIAPELVYSDSNSPKTNLRKILKGSDLFTCYESPDYTASSELLQPGDVLFSKHHVAVVISSQNKVPLGD